MNRTCGFYPDGKVCGAPATKCVRVRTFGGVGDIDHLFWICDEHYNDPRVREFWERNGIHAEF